MIPKIVHFIWMQGYNELPAIQHRCVQSWVTKNPEWRVKLWSAEDLPNLLNSWVMDTNDPVLISDVARFEIIYQLGGIYLDCDIECLQPIDNLLMFMGEDDAFISKRTRDMLASSSFGAPPGHPWLAEMVHEISRSKELLLSRPASIRCALERVTRKFPNVCRFHYAFLESAKRESGAIATHYHSGDWREHLKGTPKKKRPAAGWGKPKKDAWVK